MQADQFSQSARNGKPIEKAALLGDLAKVDTNKGKK